MAVQYLSSTLQQLYDGTASTSPATAAVLTTFRTGGDTATTNDIQSLDQRIESFESVLIGNIAAGKTSAEYPYDRAGLKREFLDEVAAMLLQRSTGTTPGNYAAAGTVITTNPLTSGTTVTDPLYKGGTQTDIAATAATGNGVFDSLNTNTTNTQDPRLSMLTTDGQAIFESYANLIDQVFAEGDKLANNPSQSVQEVSAIQPITVDGVTYDRIAQVSGLQNNQPAFKTYLLQSTAETSKVIKDAQGNAQLVGPTSSTADRLQLLPSEAALDTTTSEYTVTLDSVTLRVSTTGNGISVRTSPFQTATAADQISPLLLNVPGRETDFPSVKIVANYKYTASNGSTYLIGLSNEGKVYVTSLSASRVTATGATAIVNGMEYLLYYNEARTKILRAQLAYKEAVVREIQDDLKKANDALADLETQSGAVTATDKDGQPTNQYSANTFKISEFNATNSTAGNPIFPTTGNDSLQNATEWQTARTNLKNYIDRRSSEAQEATLDYQNTLNRFNNALDVMAKLQEKIDTLLKSQLHNFA